MNSKILIISTSLQLGGVERATSNLANEFAKQGFTVYLFLLFRHKPFFQLNDRIVTLEPKLTIPQRINILNAPFRIRKITKKIEPDTILVFNKFSGALTLLGLINLKYPVFITERNSPFYKFPLYVEVFTRIINIFFKPSGVIAQTEFAAGFQKTFYTNKTPIKVINNAVRNINLFDVNRQHFILAVGRLTDKMKGFDRIIKGFSIIKNKEWTLAFAGGDLNDGKELYLKALKYGIENKIMFLGKVKEIDMLYAKAGIFVLPSRTEGFPNALVEAMSAGMPCIAFNYNPGITEIIEDGYNGILVENGNISALAEAIDFLIENESERSRLGNNALKIKDKLAIEVIGKQYVDFMLPN